MKVSGGKTSDKAVGLSSLLTAARIRASMKAERRKVKGCIHGRTERLMKESSKAVKRRERVYGKEYMATLIWVSGKEIKLKGMEFTNGSLEIVTKVSGEDACEKVMELISLRMGMFIQVNMQEAFPKETGNTNGAMVTNL